MSEFQFWELLISVLNTIASIFARFWPRSNNHNRKKPKRGKKKGGKAPDQTKRKHKRKHARQAEEGGHDVDSTERGGIE